MDRSIQTNTVHTSSVAKSACASPHFPEDPGTSTRHIRFSTPSSSLCPSSPELSLPPSISKRVRTRPETPSALSVLAAVCSSPSVRWDGVKHQYGEGHGKSIWCEDLRMAHGTSPQTQIVDPSSPTSSPVYDERPFTFRDTMKEDLEANGMGNMQKMSVAEEMHYPTVEDEDDEDIPAPNIPTDQDYFSEFPSTPPTLVYSSPYNGNSYDFSSSSERSSTLPLSSPGLPYQHKTPFVAPTERAHDVHTGDVIGVLVSSAQASSSDTVISQPRIGSVTSTSEGGHDVLVPAVEHLDSNPYDAEELATDHELSCLQSLSPLQAPVPLPRLGMDLSLSPLSSLMSSPLSEVIDEEVSSPPPASRFSVVSDAVSVRSTSPDMDIDVDYSKKSKAAGRRASANVIGTKSRRMSGHSTSKHWQRSDTAPPETTPCKRPRQSSPSSPVSRPLQFRRLSPSRPPSSHPNGLVSSSVALQENRRAPKKHKRKIQTAKASASSKVNPSIDPFHSNPAISHQSPKRNKTKSSDRQLPDQANSDAKTSESPALSSSELTALPVTGFLVETLALSRASAIAAPELLRAVLKSQPHLIEERTEKSWSELVRCILDNVQMFGRIERRGTDAADRPLEDQWFYIPEHDEDAGRAELLKGLMPKKRDVTKRSKQYYFEPVQKVSRWDPEDD